MSPASYWPRQTNRRSSISACAGQPIGRFDALSRRPVDHDHAVVIDRFPVPVDEGAVLDAGGIANSAVTVHLPAVKGTLQPVPLDPAVGEVRAPMRTKRVHSRDSAACPAAKQSDLRAHALNVLDLSGLDVPGRRHPVPAVGKRRRIAALPVVRQIIGHEPAAIADTAQRADCSRLGSQLAASTILQAQAGKSRREVEPERADLHRNDTELPALHTHI